MPPDTAIVRRIRILSARGHTMHHIAVRIESQDDKLLVAADVYSSHLTSHTPDWQFIRDINHKPPQQKRMCNVSKLVGYKDRVN